MSVNRFESNHFQNIRSEISGKCIYLYFSSDTFLVILWGFHGEEIYTNFALYSFFKEISCVIFYKQLRLLSRQNSDSTRDRKQEGSRFHLPWLTAVVKELYICWSTGCVKYQTQWNLISLFNKRQGALNSCKSTRVLTAHGVQLPITKCGHHSLVHCFRYFWLTTKMILTLEFELSIYLFIILKALSTHLSTCRILLLLFFWVRASNS